MGALQQAPAVKYRKPEYRKVIERMLIKYPIYKQMQQIDYPPLIASSKEQVQGGLKEYNSTTEKHGIKRAERGRIIDQVEYALLFLTQEEKELIEQTYFRDQKSTRIIHEQLAWSRSSYFMKKKIAIKKMAQSLEMV